MHPVIIGSLILNFAGVVHALMLALILFIRAKKNPLNYFLAALLVVLAIVIGNTLRVLLGSADTFVFYQDAANAAIFLIGPLLYFIVHQQAFDSQLISRYWKHFLPFLLYFPLSIFLRLSFESGSASSPIVDLFQEIWLIGFWNVQIWYYLYLCYRQSKGYVQHNQKGKKWLYWLVISFAIIMLLNLMFTLASRFLFFIPDALRLNITILLSLVVSFFVYKSYQDPLKPVSAQRFSEGQRVARISAICACLEAKKMYRDPQLKLVHITQETGIPERVVSRLISEEYGQNFNEFINAYRIAQVKEHLLGADLQNITIMGIANEAGFKSNSAFYKAFKNEIGMTPKAFMQAKQPK